MKDDYGLCNKCFNRTEDADNECICRLIHGIDEITGKKITLRSKPYHVIQCGARKIK